jgi:hypothetical protein
MHLPLETPGGNFIHLHFDCNFQVVEYLLEIHKLFIRDFWTTFLYKILLDKTFFSDNQRQND